MLGARAVSAATLIFNITTMNFENSALRSNGNILLTTEEDGELLEIDPTAAAPEATVVATFDGASILGIYPIGDDQYAVVGGTPPEGGGMGAYSNSSVWTVDLSANSTSAEPVVAATIPNAELLDGVTALPADPRVVLVSDAKVGVVYRVELDTGVYEVVANDTSFAGDPGVNGLKIRDGYAYFVNSATSEFGRWAITENGTQAGEVEIIATDASSDDFALTADGIAYLTYQTSPFDVYQVHLNGSKVSVAEGASSGRPCSVLLASDGTTGYYTTAGGQVYQWEVPS